MFGTVEIIGSRELTLEEYRQGQSKHGIESSDNLELPYKRTYAWIVRDPIIFDYPVPYEHPQGAVIWVDLKDYELYSSPDSIRSTSIF